MKIYLAARYSRREEVCEYREQLRVLGHEVTSRWLNGDHQAENDDLHAGAEAERFAFEDFKDVLDAEMMISFTEKPRTTNSRGGRHVEFGIALGRMMRVWVVGPRENVFHCMEDVRQFDRWVDALNSLAKERASVNKHGRVGGER